MIDQAAEILVALSAAIGCIFMVTYQVKARWWRSHDGIHVFSFMGVMTAVLVLATLRRCLDEPAWYPVVSLIAFAGVPVVLLWRLRILLKAQSTRKIRPKRERIDHDRT